MTIFILVIYEWTTFIALVCLNVYQVAMLPLTPLFKSLKQRLRVLGMAVVSCV